MRRLILFATLPLLAACIHARVVRRDQLTESAAVDSMYWRAVSLLDPVNPRVATDSAVVLLDRYLATANPSHKSEASALRQLANDSQQLARVSNALQQAKANAAENRQQAVGKRDDDSVKEIERLKDELAKAKEELERIKKRLATPPAKP